jgi:2-dehydro-3-deoxyphosphooctonate aldolase (KDO 8-P synthase)
MTNHPVAIGSVKCGRGQPLLLIAGPCVLEDLPSALEVARRLADACRGLPLSLVFKASFDKANRTSAAAYRGPGLDAGLKILATVKQETGLPVTTDIHEPSQADRVAEACDLLQIPAFLARQTDLLTAAARTGRPVNVKKGQFMAPDDMRHVIDKLNSAGNRNVLVCERGTFFGYGRLVNDLRGLVELRQLGAPTIFDATHSVQEPGGLGAATGGRREFVPALARAAVAAGIDGLFLETHPDPDRSPSDGPNMVPLDDVPRLLAMILAVRAAVETYD